MSHGSGASRVSGPVPVDLVAIALVGLWVVAPPQYSDFGGIGQMLLGLVAVFFAPGYALVAALFPRQGRRGRYFESGWSTVARSEDTENVEPTNAERLLLGVGLSVCLVPLLGLGLNFTAWGLTRWSLGGAVGGVTLALAAVAAVRRWRVPARDRFSLSVESLGLGPYLDERGPGHAGGTRQFALAALLVLAALSVGFAAWHPLAGQSEQFTEFSIQAPEGGDPGGDLVAGEYPAGLSADSGDRLYLDITNQEGERVEYTVLMEVHRFESTGEGRTIVAKRGIDRFSASVPAGETERIRHTVEREFDGEDARLTFLLYAGDPAANPTVDNAYRYLHIWVGE